MTFAFDLISDLHVETWGEFDWTDQPTSPYCVVAGDVSKYPDQVANTLQHLSQCYLGVFYIDGNDEHKLSLENLGGSYKELKKRLNKIENVVYLQDNVVIINGVAIISTNGWWSYDFDSLQEYEDCQTWYCEHTLSSRSAADAITGIAYHDANYMTNSIKKLQTHQEVKKIVVVTHTLPGSWLCNYDPDIAGSPRMGSMGNPHLQMCLEEDTENKISVWAFGHYHRPVDLNHAGIRYVSNPKGRNNTAWCQSVYYPKRIEIEI